MSPEAACHDLLLRLADRLPDELLWRLRDWLAAGASLRFAEDRASAHASLAATLPRELLRNRIALSDVECELLAASAGAWGAPPRLLDSILPRFGPDGPPVAFAPGPVDAAALSLLAIVRGYPGCVELRQAWRGEQRVVVIIGGEQPWSLTGTAQRLLRAHGDRTPCVEVLPPHGEPSAYHQAAIIGSAPLWRSPALAGV